MHRFVPALLVVGLLVGLVGPRATTAAPPAGDFVPDEVVIHFRDGTTDAQQDQARTRVQAVRTSIIRAQGNGRGNLEVAKLRGNADVGTAIAALTSDPAVAFAEPNFIYQHGPVTTATPNDTNYLKDWAWGMYGDQKVPTCTATNPDGSTRCMNRYGSQANEAWALANESSTASYTGSKEIYVGIIDEGIDYNHPDLAANVWNNPGEIPNNNVDDDNDGYVDDVHGWNFAADNNQTYVDGEDRHGTHVAGTIGAVGNNGSGVVGVNWSVTLISGKFFGAGPYNATLEAATRAIDYFTDLKLNHGVNVVALNNSWVCPGCYSQAMHDAIIRAANANILFIAAAGNDGTNNDSRPIYPASYSTLQGTSTEPAARYDGVIAVAALDEYGKMPTWSNYGRSSVDLVAPGAGIGSTVPGGGYEFWGGTSMATPHVTGAAALYAAIYRTATPAQIRTALLDAASYQQTTSANGRVATSGRLDISCLKNPTKTATLTTTCKKSR